MKKLTPSVIGKLLGISRPTVYKHLRGGTFETATYDGGYRVEASEIDAIIKQPGASNVLTLVIDAIYQSLEKVNKGAGYNRIAIRDLTAAVDTLTELLENRDEWESDLRTAKVLINGYDGTEFASSMIDQLLAMAPPRPFRQPSPQTVTVSADALRAMITDDQYRELTKRAE